MKKTVDYSRQLFADIVSESLAFYQIGETVCGAEDPAVVELSDAFGDRYPEYAGYKMVRVIDKFVNANRSDTLLEFSNDPVTGREYTAYNRMAGDY